MTTLAGRVRIDAARHKEFGFIASTASLVAVFAASGAPIPLYERYRASAQLSTMDLALAAVTYFVAVMITLLTCGRLSDHRGRRPIGIAAVLAGIAGCLALLHVSALGILLLGRILHGIACGLASGTLTTYVVDLAPEHPQWAGTTAAASAPLIGLTLGAVGSGVVAGQGAAAGRTFYLVIVGVLALCATLLLVSPESQQRREGALASLRPRAAVPSAVRPLMVASAAVFCATWALGGFYQAFSPTISALYLDSRDPLLAGVVFASFMLPYPVGGALGQRLPAASAQVVGIAVFAVAVVGIVFGLHTGRAVTVVLSGLVAGVAQGMAFTGCLRAILGNTLPGERAAVMSTVYLISYGGAAIPSLVAGRLSSTVDLDRIAAGYAVGAVVALCIMLASPARQRTERTAHR